MTKLRKKFTLGATILLIGATSVTAFAASKYSSPSEIVAGLTGRTEESVISERVETGKTYGTIANEAGKLDEFKKENLEVKKDILNSRVEEGTMTQADADALIKRIEENQATCDGTGSAQIGKSMGAGFGRGNGSRNGMGNRNGNCRGNGYRLNSN
ncbi:DUF2680 domain-containing protein [Clostridium sediminicola]|uniref:DUF2680 domain-containing protein n=1 Tax=Clostridium sediminicola TaxID=3114879 RepID=UPI0031F225EF